MKTNVRLAKDQPRVRLLTAYVTREMLEQAGVIAGFADRLLAGDELVFQGPTYSVEKHNTHGNYSFADTTYAIGGVGDLVLPYSWVEPARGALLPDTRDYLQSVTEVQ